MLGYTITPDQLQGASNAIASRVFAQLQDNNYTFTDGSDKNGFSPQNIIATDAGAGMSYLRQFFPNLSYSAWGGTLFATTALSDPTYFKDYGIDLTPGSADCAAIQGGFSSAAAAEFVHGYVGSSLSSALNLDLAHANAHWTSLLHPHTA